MKTKSILLFLYLLLTAVCYGQEGKLFTVDRELSSSMINSIFQDKNGIVWIATEDGLNRYDGAKFTVYKHAANDEHSLLNNYTRHLFEDSKGNFFVATLSGIQLFDHATEKFTTIPMKFSDGGNMGANISSIIERKNGDVVIGTSGHGVFLLKTQDGKFVVEQLRKGIPSFFITTLHEDKNENLWLVTAKEGILRLDKAGRLKSYPKEKYINWLSSICEDPQGNIYVGSLKNGLLQYDSATDSFVPIVYHPLPHLPVKCLYSTPEGNIYIGTDGNGMKIYNVQKKEMQESSLNITSFNLDQAKVHSILKDKQGNTWLGFFQKGVMIIPAVTNSFKYIGHKSAARNIIGSCCIMSVHQSRNGSFWIGTDNDGLYAVNADGTQQAHYAPSKHPQSVSPTIMSIYEDSNRHLWIGSYRDGLAKINPQTGECEPMHLKDRDGNHTQSIYSIVEDKHKRLWIGGMGAGLYYMDLNTEKVQLCNMVENGLDYRPESNVLHNAWINCLLHTNNEKLYIGTYDGLGCLDIPTMDFASTYKVNRLLAGKVIYALHEDLRGGIWVGTSEGLKHLDPKTAEITNYTMADGLPSNSISGIKSDAQGNLWISTNYGIARFHHETNSIINFYAGDGLQGNEFSKGAACKGPDGTLIFGGTNGVTFFNPQDITNHNKAPEIRIAGFYIHEERVTKDMKSGDKEIVNTAVIDAEEFQLSHQDNSFSIEFSAMEFYSPERISYTYTFNNNKWITLQPGIDRVSFSNIAPGTYRFQVKAKDYSSYSKTKTITIVVSPPWYTAGWAKIIYLFIVVALIILIIQQIRQRYRAHQKMLEQKNIEQINEAKLQFFINISHEIRTPMSLIISPLQKLINIDKDPERQRTYNTIYRNAERILRLVNQLMDIRKIDKGQMQLRFQETDIVAFVQDLYHTFEYQAKTKQIDLRFEPEVTELKAWIDPKNFDKIVLNIISNAFKFTPKGGNISILLRPGEDDNAPHAALHKYVEIIVKDSGIGIETQEIERIFDRFYQIRNSQNNSNIGTGIGLHLTRSLIELHHGTITAQNNQEGGGCHFIIRLPLGKEHLANDEIEKSPAATDILPHITAAEPATPPVLYDEPEKIRSKSTSRVLVVEDDEEIRRYICRELSTDFHMQECANGKEALAIILQKAPDLVISDIMMPQMDGLTLCQKIKQNITINHLPVILLTAKNREEDNLEGLGMGADAYIVKPFSIEILRKTAFNLIKSREMLKNNYKGNQEQEERVQKIVAESPDERLLNRVMKVINDNLSNTNLNVETIAGEVGISRVHLHRKLKELTNQSTRDLIRNVRLKQAATLLGEKRHSITEVATLTGFANVAYFSTAFKELYGVSPSTYMQGQGEDSTP